MTLVNEILRETHDILSNCMENIERSRHYTPTLKSMENLHFNLVKIKFHILVSYAVFYKGNRNFSSPVKNKKKHLTREKNFFPRNVFYFLPAARVILALTG